MFTGKSLSPTALKGPENIKWSRCTGATFKGWQVAQRQQLWSQIVMKFISNNYIKLISAFLKPLFTKVTIVKVAKFGECDTLKMLWQLMFSIQLFRLGSWVLTLFKNLIKSPPFVSWKTGYEILLMIKYWIRVYRASILFAMFYYMYFISNFIFIYFNMLKYFIS